MNWPRGTGELSNALSRSAVRDAASRVLSVCIGVHPWFHCLFFAHRRDKLHFDNDLWVFLPPQQKKDAVPSLITVLPKAGKEKDAFEGLLGK